MREIILPLDVREYIQINFPYSLHQCEEINVIFIGPEICFVLADDFVYDIIDRFVMLLKKSFQKQLYLHSSLIADIGYLWNQELHEDVPVDGIEQDDWMGYYHLLLSPPGNVRPKTTTWLYNNEQGEIIFEITPSYNWHFVDPEPDEDFISYEDFMKQYQPYVVRTLSTGTVQQWIKQLEVVSKEIKKNTERYNRLHQYESE